MFLLVKYITQDISDSIDKMKAELAQNRKEPSSTIKQLNEMIVRMEENVRYSLPQAASPDPTTKVLLL